MLVHNHHLLKNDATLECLSTAVVGDVVVGTPSLPVASLAAGLFIGKCQLDGGETSAVFVDLRAGLLRGEVRLGLSEEKLVLTVLGGRGGVPVADILGKDGTDFRFGGKYFARNWAVGKFGSCAGERSRGRN